MRDTVVGFWHPPIVGPPPDSGMWTVFLAAPAAVPFFALLDPNLFMLVWLACVLLTSFVIYRMLRRQFPDQPPTNPPLERTGR